MMNASKQSNAVPAVQIEQLQKTFVLEGQPLPVLDRISLSIPCGAFVSMLGPSGCGKSTLLNILAGLESASAGWFQINGQSNTQAAHIAYMQQKDLLLPWRTVRDNVLLEAELRSTAYQQQQQPEAERLLARLGLADFAAAYPHQLSGGMRQRAAFARTLLCRHPILLLDEPFGALDALNRLNLQRYLHQIWRERDLTVLLVTHDVEEALQLSTAVVLLSPSPAHIMQVLPINEAWERRPQSVELLHLKAEILAQLLR